MASESLFGSDDGIMLADEDCPMSTAAQLLEISSQGARSDGQLAHRESSHIDTAIEPPSLSPHGQLVRLKQEPPSPLLVPGIPIGSSLSNGNDLGDPAAPESTKGGNVPPAEMDADAAVAAQLAPAMIEWHPAPAEGGSEQPKTEAEVDVDAAVATCLAPALIEWPSGAPKDGPEESMFVDAFWPDMAVADAEDDDLIFMGAKAPPYAWANTADESEKSATIVEEAVDVALAAGQQIVHLLHASMHRASRVNAKHWIKEFDAIRDAHKAFEVHVGVSGATGAGKTTMINALLDYDELLPSGSDGAATATACVVHGNTDKNPAKRFRATIRFKTREEISEWLRPILADVRGYYRSLGMDVGGEETEAGSDADSDSGDGNSNNGDDDRDDDASFVGSDGESGTEDGASSAPRTKKRGRPKRIPTPCDIDESEGEDDDSEVDESELRDKLMPVTAVFGLDLEAMRSVKVEDLLCGDRHPITRFLDTTKQVFAKTKTDFAHKIRPYLDCSPLPSEELMGGSGSGSDSEEDDRDSDSDSDSNSDNDPSRDANDKEKPAETDNDDTGARFRSIIGPHRKTTQLQVWPLVSHVDVYVPSTLLEGGIVLEDLPGLADAMEERVKVAQNRFRKLDATIIVAPANRAGDEATCMQLISENEAQRMRLDNQLNERTFCVVTSRVDDFDWEKYLHQSYAIAQNSDLGRSCREYTLLLQQADQCAHEINKARTVLSELAAERELAEAAGERAELAEIDKLCREWTSALVEMEANAALLEDARVYYRGQLAYLTSQLRNERVRGKIQQAYVRKRASAAAKTARQAAKKKRGQDEMAGAPDSTPMLDVLPISAMAYWLTQPKKTDRRKEGFPEDKYTGIPAVRAWIRYAVVPTRIRHGKSLLRRLDVLLHNLKTAFDMEQPALDKITNPNEFLRGLLASFQDTLIMNLQCCSEDLVARMRACNPLLRLKGNNKRFRPTCRGAIMEAVRYWNCRNYPLEENEPKQKPKRVRGSKKQAADAVPEGHILGPNGKPAKMAWSTHLAIIRRHGGEYVSGGSYRASYNWMGELARLALSEVVDQWEASFHHAIPEEAERARVHLEELWARSLGKIQEVVPAFFSGPGDHGYLAVQLEALTAIRDAVIDSVQQCMLQLVDKAKGVHPVVEDILAKGWDKAFRDAAQMSGRGSFRMRQSRLVDHARRDTGKLVKKAVMDMDQKIGANIEAFASQLEDVWVQAQDMISNHVNSMMRQIDPTARVDMGGAGLREDPLAQDRCRVVNDHILAWETHWKHSDAAARMALDGSGVPSTTLPEHYLPRPERFDELSLCAADEEEDDDDANDLELDEMPAPKRQRKKAADVEQPCKGRGRGRGGAKGTGKAGKAGKTGKAGKSTGKGKAGATKADEARAKAPAKKRAAAKTPAKPKASRKRAPAKK